MKYADPTQRIGRPRPTPVQQLERICAEQFDRITTNLLGIEHRIRDRKLAVYDECELSPDAKEWVRVR